MKLPKLSKSRPSSASASPASTPRAQDSPSTSKLPTSPLSPADLPFSPKSAAASKSIWPEKGKSLQLRLPSLTRNKSRSKRESSAISGEPSPVALPSPLGKSNSNRNLTGSSNDHRPEPLVEEIKHVFKKFDTNGDGKISADELRCVLRSLGDNMTQEEAELMVAAVDADRDGFIDLQEFIELNMHVAASGSRGGNGEFSLTPNDVVDELTDAFNMFDLDKNGCITPDELHCVLGNLGNHTSTLEDCKRMIRGVDRKGSGHVDFDDFKIMMTTNSTIMA